MRALCLVLALAACSADTRPPATGSKLICRDGVEAWLTDSSVIRTGRPCSDAPHTDPAQNPAPASTLHRP